MAQVQIIISTVKRFHSLMAGDCVFYMCNYESQNRAEAYVDGDIFCDIHIPINRPNIIVPFEWFHQLMTSFSSYSPMYRWELSQWLKWFRSHFPKYCWQNRCTTIWKVMIFRTPAIFVQIRGENNFSCLQAEIKQENSYQERPYSCEFFFWTSVCRVPKIQISPRPKLLISPRINPRYSLHVVFSYWIQDTKNC